VEVAVVVPGPPVMLEAPAKDDGELASRSSSLTGPSVGNLLAAARFFAPASSVPVVVGPVVVGPVVVVSVVVGPTAVVPVAVSVAVDSSPEKGGFARAATLVGKFRESVPVGSVTDAPSAVILLVGMASTRSLVVWAWKAAWSRVTTRLPEQSPESP
jgi:hypothetical protein